MTRRTFFTVFFFFFFGLASAGCSSATTPAADTGAPATDTGGGAMDSGTVADTGTADDTGSTTDTGSIDDAASAPDANVDAPAPVCDPTTGGTCSGGLGCNCCPAGGPLNHCICSTSCNSAADCADPTRPICQQASPSTPGFCAPASLTCCWLCG